MIIITSNYGTFHEEEENKLFDLSGQEDNEKKQEEENRLLDEEAKSLSEVVSLIRLMSFTSTRWAYECAIPFHVFERDSFVQVMQAVGQFGPNGPPPTRYEIGDTFLKKEVERTKGLMKKYEEEWESIGCSIMTDA
ncbi:hypothetical protein Tco_1436507 [Tanacetum coccineum]